MKAINDNPLIANLDLLVILAEDVVARHIGDDRDAGEALQRRTRLSERQNLFALM
ncbi:hypothetical protein SAMN04488498_1647 [Mesorhizobium albiziae]|uniref:Uncharacterized protein n=1 Tax=Neomesorhizobium albiziae TaxID=335020 RepID=A0A1I4FXI0_9HYPH|nr:hypothetical protein [Mesorhizobium albiziae]GLS31395.1 hypothetical protein GCM10007937_31050 [Mesorhizobium albiziae]SFL22213.1 hypothetical protein SAMN04488498_1647 [Mesorhizobium albiziae]